VAPELAVGERARRAVLAFPDDGGLVARRRAEVPIQAALRDVEGRAHEPLGVRQGPFHRLRPRGPEDQIARLAGPERVRALDALAAETVVLPPRPDARAAGELGGRLEAAG